VLLTPNQVRDIEIPIDSAIAVNSRTYQLQNKAEQEQLKRLVLQNERRQGLSEMQGGSKGSRRCCSKSTEGVKWLMICSDRAGYAESRDQATVCQLIVDPGLSIRALLGGCGRHTSLGVQRLIGR
jgi:hypothetical protein